VYLALLIESYKVLVHSSMLGKREVDMQYYYLLRLFFLFLPSVLKFLGIGIGPTNGAIKIPLDNSMLPRIRQIDQGFSFIPLIQLFCWGNTVPRR
jgi:hypothetical protein